MIKKAAIIQARMDSKRFPGKMLTLIAGKPLIEWCYSGLKNHNQFEIILATSGRDSDVPLVENAKKNNIKYYTGDNDNVAKRLIDCIDKFNIETFARVNGDSPFIRKSLIGNAFDLIEKENYDFVSNLIPRKFPYGISVEVFQSSVFKKAYSDFSSSLHREHVTSYFYENLSSFNYHCIPYNNMDDHDVKLVIDTAEDKIKIEKLIDSSINQMSDLENIVEQYKKLFS